MSDKKKLSNIVTLSIIYNGYWKHWDNGEPQLHTQYKHFEITKEEMEDVLAYIKRIKEKTEWLH